MKYQQKWFNFYYPILLEMQHPNWIAICNTHSPSIIEQSKKKWMKSVCFLRFKVNILYQTNFSLNKFYEKSKCRLSPTSRIRGQAKINFYEQFLLISLSTPHTKKFMIRPVSTGFSKKIKQSNYTSVFTTHMLQILEHLGKQNNIYLNF